MSLFDRRARTGGARGKAGAPARAADAAAGPVLELDGAARTYPGMPPVHALRPVDLTVHEGDFVAVVGPSGSGKSTLLNLLGLLDRPTAGTFRLGGTDTGGAGERERAALRGRRVGFVFQSFHLLPYRTALENVALAQLYVTPRSAPRARAAGEALRRVGLAHRTHALPTTMSGGERQRVAIARALVNSPDLLLCDEPTGNLDSATAASVMDLLDELNASGVTVVVITHDPAVAARARRQVTILDGALSEAPAPARRAPARDPQPPAPTPRPRPRRTRFALRDALAEALAGVVQRPGRSILTALGTVLGVGAFVAVLGLTSTATGQIGKSFSLLQDTTVTVQDLGTGTAAASTAGGPGGGGGAMDFPTDSDDRLAALNGVTDAGVWWQVPLRHPHISQRPDVTTAATSSAGGGNGSGIGLFAASPGALRAMQPTLSTGTLYNAFHQRRGERVCVLGGPAARLLGITRTDNQQAVFVDGVAYTVVGIVADVQRLPQTLLGVVIPSSTALRAYGAPADSPAQALIRTQPGAGPLVARQAPLALRPDNPRLLKAVPPPDPHALRDQVSTDLSGLFLVLAAICLVVGAVGIANTTLVAVLERTGEIGLRRALGARPRHITAQFLTESSALGLLGGLAGTALGAATVVATSLARDWTAVLQPYAVLPAPLIGVVTGFLAGLYPALRAARVEPLEALRR